MSAPVLGLDIGGTKLAVGIVGNNGRVEKMLVQPSRAEEGPDAVLRRLFEMGREAVADSHLESPGAIGISCGGPLDPASGVLLSPPHLPGWIDIPIVQLTEEEFGLPTYLENDATAAALGEYQFGAGVGANSLIYLTISTGIGGGSVFDGRLYHGAAGNGGEHGHITVRPGGRLCDSCGRRGCLEAYCSGTQIAKRAVEGLATSAVSSSLAELEYVTAADVSQAAQAGDAFAQQIWDETTDLLSQALTDMTNLFEPDVIVLGGGVTRSGDFLLNPLRSNTKNSAMQPAGRAVHIKLAALGDEVGVVGAAAVAYERLPQALSDSSDSKVCSLRQ